MGGSVGFLLAGPVQIFGCPTHHHRAEIWVYLVMCEASKYFYGAGLTSRYEIISRFPCNFFPELPLDFFCQHQYSPSNMAESQYPRRVLWECTSRAGAALPAHLQARGAGLGVHTHFRPRAPFYHGSGFTLSTRRIIRLQEWT